MRHLPILLLSLAVVGCRENPAGPEYRATADVEATLNLMFGGRMFASNGTSVCDSFGGPFSVRLYPASFSPPFITGSWGAFGDCDGGDNAFVSLAPPPDPVYGPFTRVRLFGFQQLGYPPTLWYPISPLASPDGPGLEYDITLPELVLYEPAGGTTLDGEPVGGIRVAGIPDASQGYGGGGGFLSDESGSWQGSNLLAGFPYSFSPPGNLLGMRLVASTGLGGPVVAPGQLPARIDLAYESSPAVRFTHDKSRLVMTPWPACFGEGACDLAFPSIAEYGSGLGTQFPVDDLHPLGHEPEASHMFAGTLVLAIDPETPEGQPTIIAGSDPTSLGPYQPAPYAGNDCERGLEGPCFSFYDAKLAESGQSVTWKYSAYGVGLDVVQQSWNGRQRQDYVLFGYTFINRSDRTLRFYAGVRLDLDVAGWFNRGAAVNGGRLVYQSGLSGLPYVGSLFGGPQPIASACFTANGSLPPPPSMPDPTSLDSVYQAMAGGYCSTMEANLSDPMDLRYYHSVGPITLEPKKKETVWMAIVAGESEEDLLATASAAAAAMGLDLQE